MEWDDLRHFSAFVTAGSLSGAARTLGIEHATVARRIAALEARLKLKLVDRRGRRLSLTADGRAVAAMAERMAGAMGAIERFADGARTELRGDVTISAPPAYAALVLAPRLATLRLSYPGLAIRLLGETQFVSLERREADMAVRLSRPRTGDLTASRIGMIAFHLYASPAYLATTPEAEWSFIGSTGAMAGAPQQLALAGLKGTRDSALESDSVEIQAALAASGGGIAALPDFVASGRADLANARPGEALLTREVWLVMHSDLRDAAPIRVVADALRTDRRP